MERESPRWHRRLDVRPRTRARIHFVSKYILETKTNGMSTRVQGDFNGLFGDFLCLSHDETVFDEHGSRIVLTEGLELTAFDPDVDDDGDPADLVANGRVIRSPEWLKCYGSRWALEIDGRGVYHEKHSLRE